MLPVGKDTNVAFGGKNESVRVRKELFIQMCNISILWCSMQLFSCRVCFTGEVTLQCAVLGGQCGCGLFVSWAWVEVVHSAAANQVSWASVLTWETVFTLQNDSGTNLRKYLVLGFFFSPRNISPKGFFCCWAQLLYKVTEMQSLQEHNHVAWKIKWDSFFLGIQHTAWCHYCSVSSGVPKT